MSVKVSIVIPTYNYDEYIADCINSIINSSIKNYEIIVVDDCSNIKTKTILNSFKRFECLKIYTNKENLGVIESIKIGLSNVSGETVMFLASDDILVGDSINNLYSCLKNTPAAFIAGYVQKFNDRGNLGMRPFIPPSKNIKYFDKYEYRAMLNEGDNHFVGQSILFKTDVLKSKNPFVCDLGQYTDGMLYRAMALQYGFVFFPHLVAKWRIHSKNFSNNPKHIETFNREVDKCILFLKREKIDSYLINKIIKGIKFGYYYTKINYKLNENKSSNLLKLFIKLILYCIIFLIYKPYSFRLLFSRKIIALIYSTK